MSYEPPRVIASGASLEQLRQGGVSGLLEEIIAANNEDYTALDYQLIRSAKDGRLENVFRQMRQLVYEYNTRHRRDEKDNALRQLKRIHNVFAVMGQLCLETATLIDASQQAAEPACDGGHDLLPES